MIQLPEDVQSVIDRILPGEQENYQSCLSARVRTKIRISPVKMDPGKTLASLLEEGIDTTPVALAANVYDYLPETAYPGRSLAHHLGYFYLQDLSSMLPPLVLDPKPGEKILDLAAAPGSKTTQMAQMMQNRGTLVANDIDRNRLSNLSYNLDRMGIYNTVVTQIEGEQVGKRFPEYFDKVLLDAPCSALGVLANRQEVLNWWSLKKVSRFAFIQEKLLVSAIKAVKPGGMIVYSTCTLTPEENELAIASILEKYPVELVPVPEFEGITLRKGFSGPGIPERVSQFTRRIYPFDNQNQLQGFYIAFLRKTGSVLKYDTPGTPFPAVNVLLKNEQDILRRLRDYFGLNSDSTNGIKLISRKDVWMVPEDFDIRWAGLSIRTGMRFAREMYDDAFKITTDSLQYFGKEITENRLDLPDSTASDQFQSGSNISWPQEIRGQKAVFWKGFCIGSGLGMGSVLKSQIPRSKRMLNEAEY